MYTKGADAFEKVMHKNMLDNKKQFIITANPETLMIGNSNANFDKILNRDDVTIVPDGIGVVKAGQYLGYPIESRVTGVGIAERLLKLLNKEQKSLFLFGAKEEVLLKLVERIKREYPGIEIVGYCNGYVQDKKAVLEQCAEKKPDVVLVAMGIPYQEKLIAEVIDQYEKGIFVGVGGSFDVLSGCKKRAPKIFIKLNLEWLYRIVREPKRLGRFFKSNIMFIFQIVKLKRNKI